MLPKKILSDYSGDFFFFFFFFFCFVFFLFCFFFFFFFFSGDKWRPAVACESNKLIG